MSSAPPPPAGDAGTAKAADNGWDKFEKQFSGQNTGGKGGQAGGSPKGKRGKGKPKSPNPDKIKMDRKRKKWEQLGSGDQTMLGSRTRKKLRAKGMLRVSDGSKEEVLAFDLKDLMARLKLGQATDSAPLEADAKPAEEITPDEQPELPEVGTEIDVKVVELSSTGDGLAVQEGSDQIYVVPFVVPGDVVRIKVFRHIPKDNHSVGDLLSVVTPSPMRDDSRVKCGYFARCAGCQFQPISYEDQLEHKRRVVEKAFKNFSDLPPELVPAIGETMASPLQYGYRTKLTPHFSFPFARKRDQPNAAPAEMPKIGFQQKGGPTMVLDIEDCPIGTEVVRKGMKRERERVAREIHKYKQGATLLLRESTERFYKGADDAGAKAPETTPDDAVRVETDAYVDVKTCETDPKAITVEYVDNFQFTNPAGTFFQNNNSILPALTNYIRENVIPIDPGHPNDDGRPQIRNLVDAYCGSGLFTITLSPMFRAPDVGGRSIGIDIDDKSIQRARLNARLNGIPDSHCEFIAADADKLFGKLAAFAADETAVILDPPRKGCSESFLAQLLVFRPQRIVYVSCNVHTQARDVGILVRGHADGKPRPKGGARYRVESIRGFDLFPQTSHVEGVAVLTRVPEEGSAFAGAREGFDEPMVAA